MAGGNSRFFLLPGNVFDCVTDVERVVGQGGVKPPQSPTTLSYGSKSFCLFDVLRRLLRLAHVVEHHGQVSIRDFQ